MSSLLDLCVPLLLQHPSHIGQHISSLYALTSLWSHASRAERYQLLTWWHAATISSGSSGAATGTLDGTSPPQTSNTSWVDEYDVAEWQQHMPTIVSTAAPEIAELTLILAQDNMAEAYYALASHLGPDVPITRLCTVLASVAEHCLLNRFDPRGQLMQAALGLTALGELVPHTEPSQLISMLIQQTMQLWWTYQRQEARQLLTNDEVTNQSLSQSVLAGDYLGAQSAARQIFHDQTAFWNDINELLARSMQQSEQGWLRALDACYLAGVRGSNKALSPDNAAAVAASLAAVNWQAGNQ